MKGLLASLLLLGALAGQTPPAVSPPQESVKPEDRCSVEGTVLNLQSGEPLKKAHVSLALADTQKFNVASLGAITDAAGHFLIPDVNPGKYRFSADRNGFVTTEYQSKGPGKPGTQLTLSKGQKLKDVVFKMALHGVVSGKVVDEDGEPLAGARIQVMRTMYRNGKKSLTGAASASSDDRGEFRAYGLAPGKYYVSVSYDRGGNALQQVEIRKEGPEDGYAVTFFPNGSSSAQASLVEVTAGGEASGIDFRLTPVHTARISGKITNPGRGAIVFLMSRDSGFAGNPMKNAITDDKGAFLFRNIASGSYTISAQPMMVQGGERQSAQALIEVGDSNVDGVQLTFGAAPEIAGVVAAGKGVDLKNRSLMATLSPEDAVMTMATPNGEVQDDGTFKLKLLLPDRYRLSVYPLPPEYYIKSIRYGDTESPDAVVDLSKGASGGELTVTIAADGARIDGNVQDANEQAATGVSVVLAPDQRDYHTLYKMANTDQNGHFTIKGIKPGKYKLFAWDEVQWGQYEDPDFIKPFEDKGEAIELREGDESSKDLKLIVTADASGSTVNQGSQ